MEFNDKLQELRKSKGLTQEELAQHLYVSRTAVSKWESGRGYPNIDSLKTIAKFFSVTVDELLSGDEVLTIAQEETKEKSRYLCDLVYGLLDLSVAMFFFLPLFREGSKEVVNAVSLFNLTEVAVYVKIAYVVITISIAVMGILTLALQRCSNSFWASYKNKISLFLNAVALVLFIISPQPYVAVFLFIFLTIKELLLIKCR